MPRSSVTTLSPDAFSALILWLPHWGQIGDEEAATSWPKEPQESQSDSRKTARGKGSRVTARRMTPAINEPAEPPPCPTLRCNASPATPPVSWLGSHLTGGRDVRPSVPIRHRACQLDRCQRPSSWNRTRSYRRNGGVSEATERVAEVKSPYIGEPRTRRRKERSSMTKPPNQQIHCEERHASATSCLLSTCRHWMRC
jgi:hypothetical protein